MKALLLACVAVLSLYLAPASAGTAGSAASMRDAFAALQSKPGSNPFNQPLYLDSVEASDNVKGEIYALIDAPFSASAATLATPAQWCDVLILHLNTKYCRPDGTKALHMRIGKKFDQPLEDAYRVDFAFEVAHQTPEYLQVRLSAGEGPIGTRDYRMMLEAAPAPGGKTLVRLGYAYSFGSLGKFAMSTYLSTIGRDKVGFTVTGTGADGKNSYIGGLRGVVERNTMRYYLAIDAAMRAATLPRQAGLAKRLQDWFAGSERYPLQLREMGQREYMEMKHREVIRQQSEVVTVGESKVNRTRG